MTSAVVGTAKGSQGASRGTYWRRRGVLLLAVATLIVLFDQFALGGGGPAGRPAHDGARPAPGRRSDGAAVARAAPAVESGLLPWHLPAPISREALLPGLSPATLTIAGGLEESGRTASGVFRLRLGSGRLTESGVLASATHDVAAALEGEKSFLFGGGSTAPARLVQSLTPGGQARQAGTLPQSRADASAVTIGREIYVVGGYDGTRMDRAVLGTSDGRRFRSVADLAVPVRYAAAAALGRDIYVFGGLDGAGKPVNTIQIVDVHSGTSHVVGTMPLAVSGGFAVRLDGVIYVGGGATGGGVSGRIWAWSPDKKKLLSAGRLFVPVAYGGSATLAGRAYVVGGQLAGGGQTGDVQMLEPNDRFGFAGSRGAGSPYFGERLLIADRGNDRLLLLDDTGRIVWRYPSAKSPPPRGGFYFPDDAFFIRHGTAIISNQEENDTIVEIAFPSGRVVWSYGHPRHAGTAPGYLNTPDDAYLLRDGDVTVADAYNCRVLVISPTKRVLHQIGMTGVCVHSPPSEMTSPNGDTPLPDGNLLISEITGSWVDEYTTSGHLVWNTRLPISYPSDPQQIGTNRYLIADYAAPGAIVEFTRGGSILYRYQPTSGPGVLNHPSLVERLPSGVFMANDDYDDRMIAIDPATGALVWQYGVTGKAGATAGLLSSPDGFDVLASNGTTPTHRPTG